MKDIRVSNQQELEAALKAGHYPTCMGDGFFDISGQATVHASEQATVRAWGQATVRAWGQATVHAWEQATVRASEQATVHASEQATVHAWGQATVHASAQATVHAWGEATVHAWGEATVHAWGQATVHASKYVAIQVSGDSVKAQGGVIITIPTPTTAQEWCEVYGAETRRGIAYLYKAVDSDFRSGHGMEYRPGTRPAAPDWDGGKAECGGGLHFCARPHDCLTFMPDATRFVRCPVRVSEIAIHPNPIYPQKVKAPRVCGKILEVDIDGRTVDEGHSE